MTSKLTSKKEMYPLYEAGYFGNKLQTWPSIFAYLMEMNQTVNPQGKVILRYAGKPGVNPPKYGQPVTYDEVRQLVFEWIELGLDMDLVKVNVNAPDREMTIQGEVQRGLNGLDLTYTTIPIPMRPAFEKEQIRIHGLKATTILKHTMDNPSYENLERLLDTWPDHVVEFTSFKCLCGELDWNTLFWEVRYY